MTERQPEVLDTVPTGSPANPALPELRRPVFFAGQLLTSEDLTDLGKWVSWRLALRRRPDGWGVVCGLGVVADGPLSLILGPGHAVDPAGRDLVVPQEQRLSLDKLQLCVRGGCVDAEMAGCADPPATHSPPDFRLGSFVVPGEEVRVLDLELVHREMEEDTRPVLPQPRTRTRPATCEAARKKEWFAVRVRVAPPEAGVGGTPAPPPRPDPRQTLLDLFSTTAEFQASAEWELENLAPPVFLDRGKLMDWLNRRLPLRSRYPFLTGPATGPEKGGELLPPWRVAETLFWAAQTVRPVENGCAPCPDDRAGVPLARVWVKATAADCRILFVEQTGRHRRGLSPPFVENDGALDLRAFVGQTWDSVQPVLNWYGVRVSKEVVHAPARPKEVASLLHLSEASAPATEVAKPGQEVVALVSPVPDAAGESRVPNVAGQVVGFYPSSKPAPPPFMAQLLGVVGVKPAVASPAEASEKRAAFPPNSFTKDTIPSDGFVRWAFQVRVEGLDHPGAALYIHDPLRNRIISFAGPIPDGAFVLVTDTAKVGPARPGPLTFTLLARSPDGHTQWEEQALDVKVQDLNQNAYPLAPRILINRIAGQVTYQLRAINNGPRNIRVTFAVNGNKPPQDLKVQPEEQILALETVSLATNPDDVKVKFVSAQDDFCRDLPKFKTPEIVLPRAAKKITVKINPKVGHPNWYTITVTNDGHETLNLGDMKAIPKDMPDDKGVKVPANDQIPGAAGNSRLYEFSFPGPAPAKWKIVATYTTAPTDSAQTIQFEETLELP